MSATTPTPYRVASKQFETGDTATLSLEPLAGEGIDYAPGQFTMVYGFGAGEVPISISGDPARPGELVHTIRAVGPGTRSLCALERGDGVGIRGPFGRGWPERAGEDGDLVIVAGGLGLAPLRPAIYEALARRDRLRRLTLLYGGREPDQLLFQLELENWSRRDDLEIELIVDIASPAWSGRVGVVPNLIERLELDPASTTALICGPEVMMSFAARALLERGVPAGHLFVSLERNMRCAVGHCGHCQWGGDFICRDGPVFDWERIAAKMGVREL